jgi:hypothetical protein
MEDHMQAIGRRAVFGCALAMLAGPALAQPMGPGMGGGPGMGMGGMGPGMGMGPGRGGGPGLARMSDPASYLAGLKGELGITSAQEPAWSRYAEAVESVARQMQAMHASVFESMPTADWQERRDMMNRMFGSRTEAHRIATEEAQALLPSLTEAQRTRARAILPGLMGWGPGMGRGMGRGMGMGMGPRQGMTPPPATQ